MMHSGFGSGFGHYSNGLCGPGVFFPGPLGWVVTLLFWALVIYLAVKLVQVLFSGSRGTASRLNALKERSARGEINESEYQRMKTELG